MLAFFVVLFRVCWGERKHVGEGALAKVSLGRFNQCSAVIELTDMFGRDEVERKVYCYMMLRAAAGGRKRGKAAGVVA